MKVACMAVWVVVVAGVAQGVSGTAGATSMAGAGAAIGFAAAVAEPEITDGKHVFERAAETIRNAKGLRMDVRVVAEGANFEAYSPTSQGTLRMLRPEGETTGWLMRATGKGRQNPKSPEYDFDVAWTGRTTEWVDPDKKKVFLRPTAAGKDPRVTVANALKAPNIVDARPYSKELGGASYTMEPRETVDGVECYVVSVSQSASKASRVRWAIGVEDLLPRRFENIFEGGNIEGKLGMEFSGVKLAEDLTAEELKVVTPDGFERDVVEPPKPAPPAPPTPLPTPSGGEPTKTEPDGQKPEDEAAGEAGTKTDVLSPTPSAPKPEVKKEQKHEFPAVAPDFELKTSKGEKVKLSDLKGSVVVLEFSGSWCIAARAARAEMASLVSKLEGKPVKVFTLFVREKNPAEGGAFFDRQKYPWPVLLNADEAAKAFKVRAYPTFFVVGVDGSVVDVRESFVAGETMVEVGKKIGGAVGEGKEGG
jgi:thiol-disulfide isomerase/thioredoxin